MSISLKLSGEGKEKCDCVCYINWYKYFKINKSLNKCCLFGWGTQAVLETEVPQVNTFGFISHNFKGSTATQDLWLPLGPRLKSSSPGCQWVVTCLNVSTSLIVTHLPCGFLLCGRLQWAVAVAVLRWVKDFQIRGRAACNHAWLSGLQSLWSLDETAKVLNYLSAPYTKLFEVTFIILSPVYNWRLRSPVTDTSCVIILPMLIKFQKAFSWCCSSRLYDSVCLFCLMSKL